MNKKGFAITGILYSVLVLFLIIVALLLFGLKNKKTLLDKIKSDTLNEIEQKTVTDPDAEEISVTGEKWEANNINNVKQALDYLFERVE